MQGQSAGYTPTKQKHLRGILKTNEYAWNPTVNGKTTWANQEVISIDLTSGTGRDIEGNPGSPLIINEWATRNYGTGFKQLCCEMQPSSFARLWHEPLNQCDVLRGNYQDIVPQWLEDLKLTRPALGFVYCDPNGAKDLVEGIEFFKWLTQHRLFRSLDLIFHWSMNAYKRNAGVGNDWAQEPILNVVDELARLKRYAYMREPLEKWQWVFMQAINTEKVKPVWKSERILPYGDWQSQYGGRFIS